MQDDLIPPLSHSRLVIAATARDVAALYLGYWQLLRDLQSQRRRQPRLAGQGSLIDMAALHLSGLTDDLSNLAMSNPEKAELVAAQLAHSDAPEVRAIVEALRSSKAPDPGA